MKIIRNKIIPFKGFRAINLFGVLFVHGESELSQTTINHEEIHTAQMRELLYVPFYVWYVLEWVVRLFGKGSAYRNVSFEQEAYNNEKDFSYLSGRNPYAFFKYMRGWLSFACLESLSPVGGITVWVGAFTW